MSVYVDEVMTYDEPPNEKWKYLTSCHLIGDTVEELHKVAAMIGLPRRHFQDSPPHSRPHYDLTAGMRARALGAGALDASPEFVDNHADYLDCLRWWNMRFAKHLRSKKKGKK